MKIDLFFSGIPFWGLFVLTVFTILLSISGGFRLGSYTAKRSEFEKDAPIVPVISAMLGLLAFMLAFTFGMSTSRFAERNRLLLDEANVIRTAYMHADALEESKRVEIQGLLREYVNIRVKYPLQTEGLKHAIKESEKLLDQLWSYSVDIGQTSYNRLFVMFHQSLNKVVIFHSKRVAIGIHNTVPGMVWLTLFIVTIVAMLSVGYQFGLSGRRSFYIRFVVALAFGAVLILIADLDSPLGGSIRADQKPMSKLQHDLNTSRH